MDIQKKNLLYKALAITFAIMFFSILFSQTIFQQKVSDFDREMNYVRDTLREGQVILSLKQVFNTKGVADDSLNDDMADRLFETGISIQRISSSEDSNYLFRNVSREWIYLNMDLWQKLIIHNRNSVNKKSYIIYIYPPDCTECAPYENCFVQLHKKYGENLLFFILPDDPDSRVLRIVKQYCKVKGSGPSVIVNGVLAKGDDPLKQVQEALEKAVAKKPQGKKL